VCVCVCVCLCVCLIVCDLEISEQSDLDLIWAVAPREKALGDNN
jgi:hypothetical protein